MVPKQWWKTVFDSWYLKTDGDVVEDPEITTAEIQMLLTNPDIAGVLQKPMSAVLDLCCGQGRHSLEIQSRFPQCRVFGHDQSEYLIDVANERKGTMEYPVFTVGDCRQIPYPDNYFDMVIAMGNSFGYFDLDEMDQIVLAEIHRVLKPNGILTLDLTNGGYMKANFAPRSW
jgi:D-alanine-D-alanine ligase